MEQHVDMKERREAAQSNARGARLEEEQGRAEAAGDLVFQSASKVAFLAEALCCQDQPGGTISLSNPATQGLYFVLADIEAGLRLAAERS